MTVHTCIRAQNLVHDLLLLLVSLRTSGKEVHVVLHYFLQIRCRDGRETHN